MKHFIGLIPKYLLKNKKKTFLTAITIMMSSLLLTSVIITVTDYQKRQMEEAIEKSGGNYHGKIARLRAPYLLDTDNNTYIKEVGDALVLGTVSLGNKQKIELAGYDATAQKLLNLKIFQGKYPEKEGEIALEKWILNSIGTDIKIGDKIKLDYESFYSTPDGKTGTSRGSQEFVLTGILADRSTSKQGNIAKGCLVMEQVKKLLPNDFVMFDQYLFFKGKASGKLVQDVARISGRSILANYYFLNALSSIRSTNILIIFLYIIVMTAVAAVIYNVFNISVLERIHEIGLLRAIGAEPSQIRVLIFGEGMILSILFIPLGMLLGLLTSKAVYFILSMEAPPGGISSIPASGLGATFIICLISIMAALLKPAKLASKISPIAAINIESSEKNKSKTRNKNYEFNKGRSFTYSMALLNIKRNKKRLIATVASLSISVMLFIDISCIVKWIDSSEIMNRMEPTDFILYTESGKDTPIEPSLMEEVSKLQRVKDLHQSKYFSSALYPPGKRVSEDYKTYMRQFTLVGSIDEINKQNDKFFVNCELYGCTDEELKNFSKYIESGSFDIENMKKNNSIIIVQNIDRTVETSIQAGDPLEITKTRKNTSTGEWSTKFANFQVDAVLRKVPFMQVGFGLPIVVIMHENTFERNFNIEGYQALRINVNRNVNITDFSSKLKDMSKAQENSKVVGYEERINEYKTARKYSSIILYGFLAVTVLIAAINITNTISINVILRRSEFGMLRAIGMSKEEIRGMIFKEGAMYGIFSGVIGVVLGVIIYTLAYKYFKRLPVVTWKFPYLEILLAFVGAASLSMLASVSSLRKIQGFSIVDSIKGID